MKHASRVAAASRAALHREQGSDRWLRRERDIGVLGIGWGELREKQHEVSEPRVAQVGLECLGDRLGEIEPGDPGPQQLGKRFHSERQGAKP